jgi:hypothetical protein
LIELHDQRPISADAMSDHDQHLEGSPADPHAAVAGLRDGLLKASPQGFILITHDSAVDEWVIDLDERMDGLLVAQILQAFQSQMMRCLNDQLRATDAALGAAAQANVPAERPTAGDPSGAR